MTEPTTVLLGVRRCGCITAVLVDDALTTKKDVRDFYRSMADTDRDVRRAGGIPSPDDPNWMPQECPHV